MVHIMTECEILKQQMAVMARAFKLQEETSKARLELTCHLATYPLSARHLSKHDPVNLRRMAIKIQSRQRYKFFRQAVRAILRDAAATKIQAHHRRRHAMAISLIAKLEKDIARKCLGNFFGSWMVKKGSKRPHEDTETGVNTDSKQKRLCGNIEQQLALQAAIAADIAEQGAQDDLSRTIELSLM